MPRSSPKKKNLSKHRLYVHGIWLLPLCAAGVYFGAPLLLSKEYSAASPQVERETSPEADNDMEAREVKMAADMPAYVAIPEPLKALYMTQCVAGTPSFRDRLIALVEETELNAIMIDIKDFSGGIGFVTDNPKLASFISDRCRASDMSELIARMHEKGIYVIGRITVFQDPLQTAAHPERAVTSLATGGVWKDNKGLSFIDVGAKEHWDYIIELSRESRLMGFDELNYDYVRFPSDGPMADATFPKSGTREKAEVLETFFSYLNDRVKDPALYPKGITPPVTSVDLFGMTTTNTDDLNIGQVLERALPYFDYVAPMVYPSHYPRGFNGWQNPNTVPYELIYFVMKEGVRRTVASTTPIKWLGGEPVYEEVAVATGTSTPPRTERRFTGLYTKPVYPATKLRPWIQDFDYGGNYGPAEVRAQIQGAYDAGLTSWMLWAPSNEYTRAALDSE